MQSNARAILFAVKTIRKLSDATAHGGLAGNSGFLALCRRQPILPAFVVGFALSVFLIGRLFYSGLSILDDHMIIGWLSSDLHGRIASTELAQFGTGPRFRPTMFLTIIGESWIFGDQAVYYRPLQIVMFGVFLSAFAWAGIRSVGYFVTAAMLFLVVNGRYWGNIWTHSLFPSEQFACLGLGLLIFGMGLLWSWFVKGRADRIHGAMWLIATGALICVGAKENFLPLVPMNILLLIAVWRQKAMGRAALAGCLVLIALQLVVCYGIIVPNIGRSTDMYGDSNNFADRLRLIFHTKRFLLRPVLAFAGGTVIGCYAWIKRDVLGSRKSRELAALSVLLIWVGIYACWEQFFYKGQLPANQRYDFPSLLIDPILVAAAYFPALEVRAKFSAVSRQFSVLALQLCVVLLMLPVYVSSADHDRLFTLRSAVRISNQHTQAMERDLGQMRQAAQAHPDWPILVRADHPMNYEAVLTLPLWLKHFRVPNDASVLVDIPPQETNSPLYSALANVMRDQSESGSANGYKPYTDAKARAQREGHCYAIEFGPPKTNCLSLPYHVGSYFPQETF